MYKNTEKDRKRLRQNCNKYEKTKRGFLMRVYRNMLSRVNGTQKKKAHLYQGLAIIEKDLFYTWAFNDSEFHRLFDYWEIIHHKRTHTPSIDRINPLKGYALENMRWLTHSENSRFGAINRNKKYL